MSQFPDDLARRAEIAYWRLQSGEKNALAAEEDLSPGVRTVLQLLGDLAAGAEPTHREQAELAPERSPPELDLELGRFRLIRWLGEGAHGIVYLADDTLLRRRVALKLPKPHVLFTPELRQRFLAEARAASALHHPFIVQVYDASDAEPLSFIASEYCASGTLGAWLEQRGTPLPPRTAARVIASLATAVHHAHESGILHRDIKPTNILLVPVTGTAETDFPFVAKLSDFGLAKVTTVACGDTRSGDLLGTLRYMAPEQLHDARSVQRPCDVYSLGVVLYQTLTARLPFEGPSDAAVLRRIAEQLPTNVATYAPVPKDLAAVCMKCLEKQPDLRYATAAGLAVDLQRYLDGESTLARPLSLLRRILRWAMQHTALAALIVLFNVAVVTGVLGLVFHNHQLGHVIQALETQRHISDRARDDAQFQADLAWNRGQRLAAQQRELTHAFYAADMKLAFQAFDAQLPRLVADILQHHDDSSFSPGIDPRGMEWWLLQSRIHPSQTILDQGAEDPHGLAIDKSRVLFLTSRNRPVRLFNLERPPRIQEIPWDGPTRELAYSDQLGLIAVSYHSSREDRFRIALMDSESSAVLRTFGDHESTIESLQFSHQGELIASGSRYEQISIWRLNGQRVARIENNSRNEAIAFSPDDRRLAFSHYEKAEDRCVVRIVDTTTWQTVAELPLERKDECIAFSPDGQLLAVSNRLEIRVYSADNYTALHTLTGGRETVSQLVFTRDSSGLLAGSKDGVLRWWEIQFAQRGDRDEAPLQVDFHSPGAMELHEGSISSITWEGQDRVITTGADGKTVRTALSRNRSIIPGTLDDAACADMAWFDGNLAVAFENGTDVVVGSEGSVTAFPAAYLGDESSGWKRRVDASPDTGRIASSYGSWVTVHDIKSRRTDCRFFVEGGLIEDVLWTGPGQLAVIQNDRPVIRRWELQTARRSAGDDSRRTALRQKELESFLLDAPIERVAAHRGHRILAAVVEGSATMPPHLCLIDLQTGTVSQSVSTHGVAASLQFNGAGNLLALGRTNGTVSVYDRNPLRHLRTLDSQQAQSMWGVAFSPDNKTVATGGSRGHVQLWQLESGRELGVLLQQPNVSIRGIVIAPDRSVICGVSGSHAAVYRLAGR